MALRRIISLLCGLLPLSCASPQAKAGPNGGDVEDAWRSAESLAQSWFKTRDGKSPKKVRRGLGRYVVTVQRADGSWQGVLVHNGKVVEERGTGALGTYLRNEQLLAQRGGVTVAQLLDVIDTLGAYPGVPSPRNYIPAGVRPEFDPRLEFAGDGTARFTLVYHAAAGVSQDNMPIPQGGPQGGPPGRPMIVRATLAIPADYAVSWSLETVPAP